MLADVNIADKTLHELHYYAKSRVRENQVDSINFFTLNKNIEVILSHKAHSIENFISAQPIFYRGFVDQDSIFNNRNFLDRLYLETDVKFEVLTKEQKSIIAYNAVLTSLGGQNQNIVMWHLDETTCSFVYKVQNKHECFSMNINTKAIATKLQDAIKKTNDNAAQNIIKHTIDSIHEHLQLFSTLNTNIIKTLNNAVSTVGFGNGWRELSRCFQVTESCFAKYNTDSFVYGATRHSKEQVYNAIHSILENIYQSKIQALLCIEGQILKLCFACIAYAVMDKYNIAFVCSVKSNEMYGLISHTID